MSVLQAVTTDETPVAAIHANPQDRTAWDTAQARAELDELARSMDAHGLVQPITVRPCDCAQGTDGHYVIVSGERRFRAALSLGWDTVWATVRADLDDDGHADLQLVENINRADLDPFDEALAYKARMDRFDITADEVAARYGKTPTWVKKRLDLLTLDPWFIPLIRSDQFPFGHAALMAGLDTNRQRLAFQAFVDSGGTIDWWQFQTLCKRLTAEQNQDELFDGDDFLRVQEYIDDAVERTRIGGRPLKDLTIGLGAMVKRHRQELIDAGEDADDLEYLLAALRRVDGHGDEAAAVTRNRRRATPGQGNNEPRAA